MSNGSPPFKYWAFVSYSQKDVAWADWLHPALEFYPVPRRLRGTLNRDGPIPAKLFPIFRDTAELAGAADLSEVIRQALAQSRYLIVICSPNSAASRWVDKEISTFQSLGRAGRIRCVIVDGEPNASPGLAASECFPPALRRTAHDGDSMAARAEPFAVDVRPRRDSRRKALIRLIAGILDVDFNMLWRREVRRVRRRIARGAATAAAALAAIALVYVGVADHGVPVAGGETSRLLLDRHNISLFRPVRGNGEVLETARRARDALIDRLHREWTGGAWIYSTPNRMKGPKVAISPWVSSQAMSAVFRSIGADAPGLPDFWRALDAPFAPELLIEAGGKRFGWLVGDTDYPKAAPALWTVAALAIALGRIDLVRAEQRQQLLTRLRYAQSVADIYRPVDSGGWNVVPQQDDVAQHATYATALAMLALLELRKSGLGWHDDKTRLDAMLRKAAGWLAGQFDEKAAPPGWRLNLNETGNVQRGEIADGLTLQIYATLLRAEAEADVPLPPAILRAIPSHIDRLVGRPIDYAPSLGVITRHFTNFDGSRATRTVTENYLWHPWAIDCAARWLARLERTQGAFEDRTRARRALGYLLVDLKGGFDSAASAKTPTFVASELLYSIATLTAASRVK